jgi:histidyl-tRNA synthetase
MAFMVARGCKDFSPEEKIFRNEIVDKIRTVFENYGYLPLETPMIERMDTLNAKNAGGESADVAKEIFKVSNQGGRDLGLRFDLTVPFARYIAMNPSVKLPFKRYQIEKVFRDGPIKLGRLREFWQCDVDICGSKSMRSDSELLDIAVEVFKNVGLKVRIELNNRKILTGLMNFLGVAEDKQTDMIISVDKINKIGKDGVVAELKGKGVDEDKVNEFLNYFEMIGSNDEVLDSLYKVDNDLVKEGVEELKEILSTVMNKDSIVISPSLARGLAYYTGPIYEGFIEYDDDFKGEKVTGSVCGGGRYDDMVTKYVARNQPYPAVGICFGIEPIFAAISKMGIEFRKSNTDVFVIPLGETAEYKKSLEIANDLRRLGVKVEVDIAGRSMSKNMKYIKGRGIKNILVIGESEVGLNKFNLKNLETNEQRELSVEDIANLF